MFELIYEIDLEKEKYKFTIDELSKEIFSEYTRELLDSNHFRLELDPVFGKDFDIVRYSTIYLSNTVGSITKIDIDEEDGKIYINLLIDADKKEVYEGLKSGELIIKIRSISSIIDSRKNFKLIGFDIISKNKIKGGYIK